MFQTLVRNSCSAGCTALRIGGPVSRLSAAAGSSYTGLDVKTSGGIAVVSLNRPPVNSFNLQYLKDLKALVHDLEKDSSVEGLVLTSAKPHLFSAGLDLKSLVKPSRAEFDEFWTAFEDTWAAYYMTPLSTVAAINGSCPALGAVLAISSDYRIMIDNDAYKIGLNETSLGMFPPLWLHELTKRTIGERATEFHFGLSTMFTPSHAKAVGLIDEVCTNEALLSEAEDILRNRFFKIPRKARSEFKCAQREYVVHLSGPRSVERMAESCLGDEFQGTMGAILDKLQSKSKK